MSISTCKHPKRRTICSRRTLVDAWGACLVGASDPFVLLTCKLFDRNVKVETVLRSRCADPAAAVDGRVASTGRLRAKLEGGSAGSVRASYQTRVLAVSGRRARAQVARVCADPCKGIRRAGDLADGFARGAMIRVLGARSVVACRQTHRLAGPAFGNHVCALQVWARYLPISFADRGAVARRNRTASISTLQKVDRSARRAVVGCQRTRPAPLARNQSKGLAAWAILLALAASPVKASEKSVAVAVVPERKLSGAAQIVACTLARPAPHLSRRTRRRTHCRIRNAALVLCTPGLSLWANVRLHGTLVQTFRTSSFSTGNKPSSITIRIARNPLEPLRITQPGNPISSIRHPEISRIAPINAP